MRVFLKRILGGLDEMEASCDPAMGDLAPVSVSEQRMDWSAIIGSEEESKRERLKTLGSFLARGLVSSSPSDSSVARERKESTTSLSELTAQTVVPAHLAQAKSSSRRLRALPRIASDPAKLASCTDVAQNGREWTDMLKAYGEHLTDEELLIIRAQLV